MKRILICGSNGLFGQRLALMLSSQTEYEVLNTSRKRSFVFDDRLFDYTQLDITKKGDVMTRAMACQIGTCARPVTHACTPSAASTTRTT